ncbi:hypothetical protein H9X85_02490 [Anaerotignum lactatifermentans]|uniref:Uncharacterized protein n=1 Tax=Anaerotignum lactatifermentans TaxID=160404 RepID=A0ABS2GBP0_9FIRM|nr:hypothetical protein [Anaerotignum lactatifermentans]MBM6828502.1 hypothetical protein [Anaerotignum lactatifermentans]MBM6877909.1 hypothetical protein [Anaerotignum lactatifermentans]MBM6950084.1 hypothetical protein [Anaerotignum lactatifermentans]
MKEEMNEKTKKLVEAFSKLDNNSQSIILTSASCLLARQEMDNKKAS